jgi:hypothetical protein
MKYHSKTRKSKHEVQLSFQNGKFVAQLQNKYFKYLPRTTDHIKRSPIIGMRKITLNIAP